MSDTQAHTVLTQAFEQLAALIIDLPASPTRSLALEHGCNSALLLAEAMGMPVATTRRLTDILDGKGHQQTESSIHALLSPPVPLRSSPTVAGVFADIADEKRRNPTLFVLAERDLILAKRYLLAAVDGQKARAYGGLA